MRKLVLVMALIVIGIAPTLHAAPQPLTDQQIEQIRRNCVGAQGFLQTIQRNDTAARINRGRTYESLTKLLATFNSRVVLNKLNAPLLVSSTSGIEAKFTIFQQDYLTYQDSLSTTLRINCREQPVTFYDSLTAVREQRTKIEQDIKDINLLLDDYQKGIVELKASIAPQPIEAAP